MNRIFGLLTATLMFMAFAPASVSTAQEVTLLQDSFFCGGEFVPAEKPKLPGFLKAAVDNIKRSIKRGQMPEDYLIPSYGHIVVVQTEEDWQRIADSVWHPKWGPKQQPLIEALMAFYKSRDAFVINHRWPIYINANSPIYTVSEKAFPLGYDFPEYTWLALLAHERYHVAPEKCGAAFTEEQMHAEELRGAEITVGLLQSAEKAGKFRGLPVDPKDRRVVFVKDQEEDLKSIRLGVWRHGIPALTLGKVTASR